MQEYQGIYFEKGIMEGCVLMFPQGASGVCIGTEEIDGPDLIVKSPEYIYLCITGSNSGSAHDYFVVEDFDGPIKLRHSGHVYDFGTLRLQLL